MNPLGFTPCLTLERPNLTADPSRTLFRAKKLFPELVYDTAALEDSPYTFPEVQALLEGITVGGHRLTDQKLVLNQAESWKALIRLVERGEFREDKATFLALHRLVAESLVRHPRPARRHLELPQFVALLAAVTYRQLPTPESPA